MIKDSGERRQFETGAVRDIQEGKGRCDLLPLKVVGQFLGIQDISYLGDFMTTGDENYIYAALNSIGSVYKCAADMILDVSIHYEEGCEKYGERNWEKGIPCHCFVDSAVRHLLKVVRGDEDEPHIRAYVWNLLGLLWTLQNKPELNDLPFNKEKIV